MNNPIALTRETNETQISLKLTIDGQQHISINSGIAFFDHMLNQLAFHAGWDLELEATGDIEVDDHHLVEDVALLLGQAIEQAWRTRSSQGFNRYGKSLLPMDEALVLCALDLSGRPCCVCQLNFTREYTGKVSTEMWPHFFRSFSQTGQFTLHLQQMNGENNHHIIEAAFKATAMAFKQALASNPENTPSQNSSSTSSSTKGLL
ncbi:MAG TPA: imidazoleglycerol-phosphate dehydratase HisB [Aeromonadales bacterium]|nr:imidazoleglycerol-phosphate dehydratase HisB [Aeromonadales bacterium]